MALYVKEDDGIIMAKVRPCPPFCYCSAIDSMMRYG